MRNVIPLLSKILCYNVRVTRTNVIVSTFSYVTPEELSLGEGSFAVQLQE
nr:MAG TPA: hypothetical protein [Caudoviricetes sp.]